MSTFLVANSEPSTPDGAMRFVEKDAAIVRGVTKAMVDFSNIDTYAGASPILDEVQVRNLVVGGVHGSAEANTATVGAGVPLVGGMATTAGMVSGAYIELPADFIVPVACTKGLAICWAKVKKTGWPTGAQYMHFFGCSGTTSGSRQYMFGAVTDAAGVITTVAVALANQAGWGCSLDISGASVDQVANGALHQIGVAWEITDGVLTAKLYVDKALFKTSTPLAATSLANSSPAPVIFGSGGGFNGVSLNASNRAQDTRIGRASFHDMTGRSDVSFEGILAADWDAAQGYVS